jgi:geranylgeranyl reductase
MVSIIGAGPAGTYLASLIANKKPVIFEEHNTIGKPLQCTGLVTQEIRKLIPLKKNLILNKINKIRIFSPNKDYVEINFKKPNLILDRVKFDQYLAEEAIKKGVKIYTNHKFIDYKKPYLILQTPEGIKRIKTNILIGADGVNSRVSRIINKKEKRKLFTGIQARVNLITDPEIMELYLSKNIFAWVVPESYNISKIGLVSFSSKLNNVGLFRSFLKKRAPNTKIREYISGLIPLYNPKLKTKKGNIYLVGDAATMVKATSFGGIIQSLTASRNLADSLLHKKNYKRSWKKSIGKDLKHHLYIRKILNKFSDKDYNELIKLSKKIKPILEAHERESPKKLLIKSALKQPKLLKFVKKLI